MNQSDHMDRCPACLYGQPWFCDESTVYNADGYVRTPYRCWACQGTQHVSVDRVEKVKAGLELQTQARAFHKETGGLLADFAALRKTTPQDLMREMLGYPSWLELDALGMILSPEVA